MSTHKIVALVVLGVLVAIGVVFLVFHILGPCHSAHMHRQYHAAYTSYTTVGDVQVPTHHPERCAWESRCDLRCKDWDKGQTESHGKHQTNMTDPTYDHRCRSVDGTEATP